jgi:hypothetical protein
MKLNFYRHIHLWFVYNNAIYRNFLDMSCVFIRPIFHVMQKQFCDEVILNKIVRLF